MITEALAPRLAVPVRIATGPSLLQRIFDALVELRWNQARRHVEIYSDAAARQAFAQGSQSRVTRR